MAKCYTFNADGLKDGLLVKAVLLKDGKTRLPAVVLGERLWVTVANAPTKPCPRRTEGAYGHREFGSSWTDSQEAKPQPSESKTCPDCGTPYGTWIKERWDNHPGQYLDNPECRGHSWRAYHPDQGQVYTRIMEATIGETKTGKPKLIGAKANGSKEVIVRIMTKTGYTRNCHGLWRTLAGEPKTIASAETASGSNDSLRIGSALDGLVLMQPGDVVQVNWSSGHKSKPAVLFFDADGQLTSSLLVDWQAGQTAQVASEAVAKTVETISTVKVVDVLYGTMPVFSFGTTSGKWDLTGGIDTQDVPGGRGIKLGPRDTSWRSQSHVVVAVADEFPPTVTRAAVAKVGKNYALVTSSEAAENKFLVRIDTAGLRKGGRTGATMYRGTPEMLTEGSMEHGTKNVTAHKDQLWVVSEGDVLRIGQTWHEDVYASDYAIVVENGKIRLENFFGWMLEDARRNPAPYIAEGWAPVEHVPAEWVGRIVETYKPDREQASWNTFLLKSVRPEIILDSGWDELPPKDWKQGVSSDVAWLKLRSDLNPQAELVVTEEEVIHEFGTPPLPHGTRTKAQITTKVSENQGRFGNETVTAYTIVVENIPADKVRVTKFEKSGERGENREQLGQELVTWSETTYAGSYCRLWIQADASEGSSTAEKPLNGTYNVEFYELRKGSGFRIYILTDDTLEAEKQKILAEVKANLPLRKLARRIPGQREGETPLFGMPMKPNPEDGWLHPCKPEEATTWVMYMADHKWENSFPDAYVLVPMKGYRSKSTGRTFQELVRDFNR